MLERQPYNFEVYNRDPNAYVEAGRRRGVSDRNLLTSDKLDYDIINASNWLYLYEDTGMSHFVIETVLFYEGVGRILAPLVDKKTYRNYVEHLVMQTTDRDACQRCRIEGWFNHTAHMLEEVNLLKSRIKAGEFDDLELVYQLHRQQITRVVRRINPNFSF